MALTQQITDGVHRVADGLVNWYLVDDGGEVAIYDAGWPRSWPRVEAAIKELGRTAGDVTAIVLTHGHPDDLGAAEWVKDVTPFTTDAVLDVPGRPRVVATSGHTAGHVSFLLEDRGVVVTGDAIATFNVLTRSEGPQLMPDALNADPQRTRKSLDILADLSADTLLPGHGDPFHGRPADAGDRATHRARS